MEPEEPPAYPLASSTTFGSTKREVLLVLKREGQSDLQSLAEHLHISKMAVHKHVQELEDQGMIQRVTLRGAKGRPRHGLQLAPKASSLFPKAYAGVTCAALAYIDEKLSRTFCVAGNQEHSQATRNTSMQKRWLVVSINLPNSGTRRAT